MLLTNPDGTQYCICEGCHAHLVDLLTRLESGAPTPQPGVKFTRDDLIALALAGEISARDRHHSPHGRPPLDPALLQGLSAGVLQQQDEIDRLRALVDRQDEERNAYQCARLTSPSERGDGVTPTSHTMPAG